MTLIGTQEHMLAEAQSSLTRLVEDGPLQCINSLDQDLENEIWHISVLKELLAMAVFSNTQLTQDFLEILKDHVNSISNRSIKYGSATSSEREHGCLCLEVTTFLNYLLDSLHMEDQ